MRRMSEAGVRMTAGSDSPWGWYAPGEFVHEIHMLAQAGLRTRTRSWPAPRAPRSPSASGAVAGRLRAGRGSPTCSSCAAIPTREITALWDVLDVYQAGRRVERDVA